MADGRLTFRILGTLEAVVSGKAVALGAPKQRALLAALLIHANEPVSMDALAEALWGDRPPPTATTNIQIYVSQLRKLLGGRTILTEAGGYRLSLEDGELDARRFEELITEARSAHGEGRAEVLREALELWHGEALGDFRFETFAQNEAARLDELRLAAVEDRIAADLDVGCGPELIPELGALIEQHPLRERLRRHLMLALYRAGRQADALEAYGHARAALDDLGLAPSAELQELERAILNHNPALAPAARPRLGSEPERPRPPVPATPIVGRRAELTTIREMLADPSVRLLTMTGPGGTGKTRLALEVLHAVESNYTDGAFFVALAPVVDPDRLLSTIAQCVGVRDNGRASVEAMLHERLHERDMLLVLDNFEQLAPAAEQLLDLLAAAPRLQMLVTSRACLRLSSEYEMPVPPLERGDALALLIERAHAARPDFEAASEEPLLGEICARLDDLPLAIELAAARLKVLSPEAMLGRLDERLRLLTGGARDLPARQRTLRATLDWSYDLLTEDERQLLARLSVFVGGCTLEAAEVVCGDAIDVFEGIASLVDKSLARVATAGGGDSRLTMLQTIREYAQEQLRTREEHATFADRHAEYYLRLAEEASPELSGPDQARWFDRLESEHDNLRAALAVLVDRSDAERAASLAASLWKFWQTRGFLTEGTESLDRALELGPPPVKATADALNAAGCLADSSGRYERAIEYHSRASALYEDLHERPGVAWSLNNLALVHTSLGKFDRAAELHERSLGIARDIGEERLIASSLINLANVAYHRRDYALAEELQEEGRQRSQELGDTWREAIACLNLGWIHLGQGDTARASSRLYESIEHFRRLEERPHLSDAIEGLAAVAANTGDAERAARLFGAGEALRASVGAPLVESEQAIHAPYIQTARELLGEERYQQAANAGRVLTAVELIGYAMQEAVVEPAG
jgi:predicted ATPase/DNA-binding SARP family transcriptional activator